MRTYVANSCAWHKRQKTFCLVFCSDVASSGKYMKRKRRNYRHKGNKRKDAYDFSFTIRIDRCNLATIESEFTETTLHQRGKKRHASK